MRKCFSRWVRFVGVSAIAVFCAGGAIPSYAAVKLIGGFEGTMASGYPAVPDGTGKTPAMNDPDMDPDPADWFTDIHITTLPQFVSSDDPQYGAGVTQGDQALLYTFPQSWAFPNTAPYLRLHGHVPMLTDTADFPYLMMDITTFGHPDTIEEDHPLFRQVFSIFNGSQIGFYDRTNGDIDVQQDVPALGLEPVQPPPEVEGLARGDDVSRKWTLVVDMTGPPVPYPHTSNDDIEGDGKTSMQYLANQVLLDHTDGTPIANFAWQLIFAFQGDDEGDAPNPAVNQIEMVIDNIRFCDEATSSACQAVVSPELAGDYNENDVIDAADYTVWRDTMIASGTVLANDPTPGTVDESDFIYWRDHFGDVPGSGAGSGSSAIPEPSSLLLSLSALVGLAALGRKSRAY